jgi:polar amino acid transport system substrate-binding protein
LADTITIRADEWCPYTCDPRSDHPGYLIEIAKRVFEAEGHRVDYKLLPWPRAVSEVKRGVFDAIAGGGRKDTPDFVFTRPMGEAVTVIASRKGAGFKYKGPESFGNVRLGAPAGVVSWGAGIDEYIAAHQDDPGRIDLSAGEDAYEVNLKKLLAGRVDAIVDDGNVLHWLADELGVAGQIETVPVLREPDVYVAFAPGKAKSSAYAAMLDAGVRHLRETGELAEIMTRYGLPDWESQQ